MIAGAGAVADVSADTTGADPWALPAAPAADWTRVAGLLPQNGEAGYELAFWNSIKDSTNAADYEAYLQTYPNGRFASLAKARIEQFRKAAAPTPPPAPAATPEPAKSSFTIAVMDDYFIASTSTNVREQPASDADRIDTLAEGERVHVTGKVQERDWYRVRTDKGADGYVYAALLSQAAAPAPQPARVETPPPPPVAPPAPVASTPAVSSGKTFKDCPNCPEMAEIAPGTFLMGSERGDPSEQPAHTVTLASPFAIGRYEVTVDQWKACVAAAGCNHISDKVPASGNAPISDISWSDAQEYVRWLSSLTGQKYRLPTEAEWEYAARAGSRTRYWWGDTMLPGKAYCKDCGGAWNRDQPADVGSMAANPFGLYDMNGNVWEWVADCWHRNYDGAPRDGSAWTDSDCREHVIRGGSWRDDTTYVHSASRFYYDAYVRYILNGFRVARSLK